MSTLFISDLHLEDSRPETSGWLLEFLAGPARQAEAVYILGDLFEYWIGDDAVTPTARAVAAETARLATGGLALYFQHGNRDFLLGEHYAALAGFSLLPESVVVDLHGTATLLLHGDSLCTDDEPYQAFRRQSRDPAWQATVLAMTVEERIAMARNARETSMQHKGAAALDIMDVNEAAVIQAFKDNAVARIIHGHTHRPAVHHHDLGGGVTGTRIVLADWYQAGSYLEVNAEEAVSRTL
ncbi:MAG: UDP-2,3-diacylglucosamine diphosphatase [Xanthomonadales bacterium]|jgi:UDP-2,3-diacylglucosamine hydrolase|nr:UDP-2,3-diacylglucosamine diphosphatase [Xanthomonadales bacterium]